MNWKKTGIVAAIVVVIIAVIMMIKGSSSTDKATSVKTAKATEEKIISTLSTTGTLIPNASQTLNGQEIVTELNVEVGDLVKKDQVIAKYSNGFQLKANMDGTVTAVNIKKNEPDMNGQIGKPSIQIDDLSTLKIEVRLSKSEAADCKLKQKAIISNNKETYQGTVNKIDPIATSNNQSPSGATPTLRAIVEFDTKPTNLFAGFDVDVDIETATEEQALVVPIEAIKYDKNNQAYVYKVTNHQAKKVAIDTKLQSNTKVQVTKGLAKDDLIILSPDSSIKNGLEVTY